MANNDGGQGWVVANIPYDHILAIARRTAKYIRTELRYSPVTARRNGLEARVGIAVGCDECDDEH